MAFLGDVGKIFLGGMKTGDVVASTAQSMGASPTQAQGIGNLAQGVAEGISRSNRTQQGQSTAVAVSAQGPSESQSSGTITQNGMASSAGMYAPSISPAVYTTAGPVVPRSGGMVTQPAFFGKRALDFVLGFGTGVAPMIMDAITGEEKKLRVTRKLKSQVKQSVNLVGIEATAQAMGVNPEIVLYILTKKMRNDGAYVTKAAVRKTRSTVRKMKNLCDMYDDLRPPAKRRSTTTRSRASTTLIKN